MFDQQVRRNGRRLSARALRGLAVAVTAAAVLAGTAGNAAAALPPGNAAQQWDQIAEDTVVGSGAFQGEGFVYMAYVAKAMHGAVSPGERHGQSADAAVSEAAYQVLVHYFPTNEPGLTALHDAALAAIPDGAAKRNGIKHGGLAVPDAGARARRVAADAGRLRGPADAVDGQRAAVRAQARRSVPAFTAPVAVEPAVGRGVQ
jgi:hypothetical protein